MQTEKRGCGLCHNLVLIEDKVREVSFLDLLWLATGNNPSNKSETVVIIHIFMKKRVKTMDLFQKHMVRALKSSKSIENRRFSTGEVNDTNSNP